MNLEEIVSLYECPVCKDFPRPYLPVENCTLMHMICGLCFAQIIPQQQKKECVLCKQEYKKYGYILPFHRPLEIAQSKYLYTCLNKDMGCTEMSNSLTVETHDKLCEFVPYKCTKEMCDFLCSFKDIANQSHIHLKVLFGIDSPNWEFDLPFQYFYSKAFQNIRLSRNVPCVVLLRGDRDTFDVHFRPTVVFSTSPAGDAIRIKIVWYCNEIFSFIDLSEFQFLITFYVDTEAGILKRSFISNCNYLHSVATLQHYNDIFCEFFHLLERVFSISKCLPCNSKNPHFHIKISLLDSPPILINV